MKLRTVLFVLFCVLTLVPAALFWVWPHSRALENEFDEVRGRHLLLARNLGAALERYHRDVSAAFDLLSVNLEHGHHVDQAGDILLNLEFRHICLADANSGRVISQISPLLKKCPDIVPKERFAYFASIARADKISFTEVMAGPNGQPMIYLLRRWGDKIAIGALTTEYFVRLGKAISFGAKGHAAIVDHKGNVLAHPLDSWVAERKNISKVSAVKRMLNGETGIDTFYSPALKSDMVAGFTSVSGPGWGVMIPQPVEELIAKAERVKYSVFTVFAAGIAIAAGLAIIVAFLISRPLERIIAASRKMGAGDVSVRIDVTSSKLIPAEFRAVEQSFNAMAGQIHQNLSQIESLAYIDIVTGLPNRECFRTTVESDIAKLRDTGESGALVFIDLDGFKNVNDALGHDTGDELLMHLAHRVLAVLKLPIERSGKPALNGECRECKTTFARMGGDEFVIFVPNSGDDEAILADVENILEAIGKPFLIGNNEVFIGASAGVARFPKDGDNYKKIVNQADAAMYRAKRSGKNTVCLFDKFSDATAIEEHQIGREIRSALRSDEIVLYYQPKISCKDGGVTGLEALIRWQHPERGLLLSGSFVPFIESSVLIIEVGEWVLEHTALQILDLTRRGRKIPISVNISAKHFADSTFADRVVEIVNETGIEPSLLEIEVTEAVVLNDLDRARSSLQKIRDFGVRVAIDDFGRGYSNLSRIAFLPFDVLKIDMSFIARITTEKRMRVIVESIIDLASGLNCITVAEGVETSEQAECLKELGCDQMQGFLYAVPMLIDEVEEWLADRQAHAVSDLQDMIADGFQSKVA
jgi:predicted signal transduction protein with EAL and GGDEF domain